MYDLESRISTDKVRCHSVTLDEPDTSTPASQENPGFPSPSFFFLLHFSSLMPVMDADWVPHPKYYDPDCPYPMFQVGPQLLQPPSVVED